MNQMYSSVYTIHRPNLNNYIDVLFIGNELN